MLQRSSPGFGVLAGGRTFEFRYDDIGNLTSSPLDSYTYPPAGKPAGAATCVARPECNQ